MLDKARATLEQTLAALRSDIDAGTPIIGLEPSCVSVFRDEMTNLLGDNVEAQRLRSQTYLLERIPDQPGRLSPAPAQAQGDRAWPLPSQVSAQI